MPFDPTRLAPRLRWLIGLRWIAVVAVVITILVSSRLGYIQASAPLLVIAGALAAANLAFTALERRGRGGPAQVVTDLLALTFLLHYAGGSQNPFAFLYVFHVVIASILFSDRTAYATALGASLLFGGLTAADVLGYCPRHPIVGAVPPDPAYAFGRLAAFALTVLGAAYMGSTIVRSLRAREAELGESRDRLAQAEKLAAIGQLAAGIAHELNTPLGSILVAGEVAREASPAGSESAQLLGDVVREAKRCKEITRSLLDFSRKRDLSFEATDLAEVVRQAVGLVKREAGARADCVAVDAPGDLPRVRTDAGALGQVVVNVVKNALDAVEGRPAPSVSVRAAAINGSVEIRIRDNGKGIPPADLARIYEPFFTTKEVGKGTGLGLSLSYSIMRDLQGEIGIESAEGAGTDVRLVIPVA